jgi:hypothetical protein
VSETLTRKDVFVSLPRAQVITVHIAIRALFYPSMLSFHLSHESLCKRFSSIAALIPTLHLSACMIQIIIMNVLYILSYYNLIVCYTNIILILTSWSSEYRTSKLGRCITQAEQALGFGTFVDEGSVLARDNHQIFLGFL